MNHVVELTYEQKVKMYKKCTKKQLVEMLLENQRLLEFALNKPININYPYQYPWYIRDSTITTCTCSTGGGICNCNKSTIV